MYKALSPGHIFHTPPTDMILSTAEKYGFDGVFLDIQSAMTIPAEELRERMRRHGQRPAGFGLPLDFGMDEASYAAALESLDPCLSYASACGFTSCCTYFMPGSDTRPYEENWQMHLARVRQVASLLNAYNMTLGLEFVGTPSARRDKKYEFIHTLREMLDFCREVGTGNVGILLDSFHWDMAGREDFSLFPDASWITCVHINDELAGVSREEHDDLTRALPGSTGVLPIADFFRGLTNLGYDGPVLCEPFVAELGKMEFDKAAEVVKTAIDQVWPS